MYCSESCKKVFRYHNDPDYRERNNSSRAERQRLSREDKRREEDRQTLLKVLYLFTEKEKIDKQKGGSV